MKKLCTVMMILALMWVPAAFADDVSETLAGQASERIQENTRAMIEAGIDSRQAIDVTRAMLRNRFSEEHALRAQDVIRNARKQELPVEPVMNKAYEGMAKQVRAEKVIRAMETVRERYAYAFGQAATLTDDGSRLRALGEAMADSLAAGMARDDCDKVMTHLREMTRDKVHQQVDLLAEEVFTTTRSMARIGVSSAKLTDMVTQSLQSRYTIREMAMLRERFMTNALSHEPDRLARDYAAQIGQGERAEALGEGGPGGMGADKGADSAGENGGGSTGGPGGEDSGAQGSDSGAGSDGGAGSGGASGGGDSGGSGGSGGRK